MARSPRSAVTPQPISTPVTPVAGPSKLASSVNPLRKSSRRQASAPSTPATPVEPTPPSPPRVETPQPTPSSSKIPPPSRQPVEFKAHALRSVIGGNERSACPFPSQYGGKEKCCLTEEEESDEVLMSICAACAAFDNRALSPDEIASICFNQGWLRPPSAAVEPSTIINNAIRSHQRKCQNLIPPRQPLLSKYQLSGSSVEAALEPSLHPDAFSGNNRPKGPVWYLNNEGRANWKNPFDGVELPKLPPRKVLPKMKKPIIKGKTKAVAPVKIRLVVNSLATEPESESEPSRDSTPVVEPRRDFLDSSDEESSDSDSEPETRRIRLKPLNSPRPIRQPQSPFLDLFFPSPNYYPASPAHTSHSPFPSHSLDNTTWAVRHEFTNIETSSSSSDDELREQDWGTASGILVRADDEPPFWTAEDETKVSEATDAMKFLFPTDTVVPMSTNEIELDRLDNQPAPSDTSSLAESSSTATACYRGQLKAGHEPIALPAWTNLSSPVSSPNLRFAHLPHDTSPTTHLSKLKDSFDSFDTEELGIEMMDLDLDVDESWLDEGELPVKAEDTFSDGELCSTLGEASTPEHDRQLNTAAWAREAAAAVDLGDVKQEPEDFPSPATTIETYERNGSRESSTSSHTPSSKSSELPPFEIDDAEADMVMLGPESISLEEVDKWMIGGKDRPTPRRPVRGRQHETRCSGSWGGIGVGNAFPLSFIKAPTRSKSHRRRRRSPPVYDEMEIDAFGTEDLELAKAEAEAREEQRFKERQEQAEKQRLAFQACRQALKDAGESPSWSETSGFEGQAMSPLALQSLSTLSIGVQDSVDPKALTSPPVGGMIMLDEVLSQAEVDAVMNSFTPPKPTQPPPKPIAVAPKSKLKITLGPPPKQEEPKPKAKSTSPTLPTAPPPPLPRPATFKILMAGVAATVVDSIPIYTHSHVGKEGPLPVLRRLDSDFVNGSALLCALGVPTIRANSEYLNAPSEWLEYHVTVPTISADGTSFSSGVPGVWVPLVEAQDYAKRLKLRDDALLSVILRDDLFVKFAAIAKLSQNHSAALFFGSDFVAGYTAPMTSTSASKSTPNLSTLGTSLPVPIPSSTSSTSPMPTTGGVGKTSLVRSAPATPHENCPLPKKRRPTIGGESKPTLGEIGGTTNVGIGGLSKIIPGVRAAGTAAGVKPLAGVKPVAVNKGVRGTPLRIEPSKISPITPIAPAKPTLQPAPPPTPSTTTTSSMTKINTPNQTHKQTTTTPSSTPLSTRATSTAIPIKSNTIAPAVVTKVQEIQRRPTRASLGATGPAGDKKVIK